MSRLYGVTHQSVESASTHENLNFPARSDSQTALVSFTTMFKFPAENIDISCYWPLRVLCLRRQKISKGSSGQLRIRSTFRSLSFSLFKAVYQELNRVIGRSLSPSNRLGLWSSSKQGRKLNSLYWRARRCIHHPHIAPLAFFLRIYFFRYCISAPSHSISG